MDSVIRTTGLVKTFGRTRALDGLDLEVAVGEVHGFLGPNGAGKSTTIRVLLGMLRPSAGTATVFGLDAWRQAIPIHRRLASVPGDVTLWPNLTGGEAIDTITRLRGGEVRSPDRERLIEAFDLDPRKRCRSYSKGNRQKVALIAAFLTPAELYLLDEPTSGLDPLMEQVFREEVARATARGVTVLLSSHILSEVEQLCSRVSIIRQGQIVESGTLEELRHLAHTVVGYRGAPVPGLALDDEQVAGDRVSGTLAPASLPAALELLAAAVASGRISNLTMHPPSLEELFLRHYGGRSSAGHPGAHAGAPAPEHDSAGDGAGAGDGHHAESAEPHHGRHAGRAES